MQSQHNTEKHNPAAVMASLQASDTKKRCKNTRFLHLFAFSFDLVFPLLEVFSSHEITKTGPLIQRVVRENR